MALNKKDIEKLKQKLEEEAKELRANLKEEKIEPEFGDDIDGYDEETDEAQAFSNQIGLQQNTKNELEDVEEALRKIEEGKYGKCDKCGKDISLDLLEIDPESHLCKDCKKESNKKNLIQKLQFWKK